MCRSQVPASVTDIVDKLVPELQERGVYRTAYRGTTCREHLDLAPLQREQAARGTGRPVPSPEPEPHAGEVPPEPAPTREGGAAGEGGAEAAGPVGTCWSPSRSRLVAHTLTRPVSAR